VTDIAFPIDFEGPLPPKSQLKEWSDLLLEASRIAGKPLDSAKSHKERLKTAGFEDVVEEKYYWPQNTWAGGDYKELGMQIFSSLLKRFNLYPKNELIILGYRNLKIMGRGIEAMSLALFTRYLRWSPESVYIFLIGVRKELKDMSIHAYWTM
jgi:hypothetical protein